MTIYIVHSIPLLMSVVQVFVNDRMAFVSHLIKADSVGSEKHLGINFKVKPHSFFVVLSFGCHR